MLFGKLAELNSLNEAFPKLAKDIVDKKVRSLKKVSSNKTAFKQ